MSEGGWVKLYRCLMGKAIWKCSSNDRRVILITILMLANHEPNQWMWKGEKFEVQAGQFITSYSKLAETCNVTRECCRCALSNFEKMEFITREATQSGLLVTVVNWAFYQGSEETTTHPTPHEHHTNNTQTTREQHTNNTRTTPNKNDKNDKNDKNVRKKDIYGEYKHVQLTADEYQRLIQDYGQDLTERAIRVVDEYVESSGKKYKNYNLTIRKWGIESARKEEEKNAGCTSGRRISAEQYYRELGRQLHSEGNED